MERETPTAFAHRVIAELEKSHPDAVRLAEVTSLAVRIDPAFLREARLALLPGVPSDAEADLWFSSLVESRSAVGFVLEPAVSHLLRQSLSLDEPLLLRAWALRQRFHPYLSPEMRLEEEVSWLALMEPDDEKLNEVLMRSVKAMSQGGERALGVARWALRAMPRLPDRALRTEAALALAFGTSERMGFSPLLFLGTEETPLSPKLIQGVSASEPARGTCRVGMMLRENALEFAEPAPDGWDHVMELPDTQPRLLELSWSAPQPGRRLLVAVPLTAVVPLPEGVRDLKLRSLGGDFQLTASEHAAEAVELTGEPAPEEASTSSEEETSTPSFLEPMLLRVTCEPTEAPVLRELLLKGGEAIVVEAPDGYGKETLVRRVFLGVYPVSEWIDTYAAVRLQGILVGTKGFLNNLAVALPYESFAYQKFRQATLRSVIQEVVPNWEGRPSECLVDAILQAASMKQRRPESAGEWEEEAANANRILLEQHPKLINEFRALLGEAPEVKPLSSGGKRPPKLLTGRQLAMIQPRLLAAMSRAPSTSSNSAEFKRLISDMASRAVALVQSDGAAGLEQFLEQDFLPHFQDKLLLVLVEGLDSISVERALEFVQILSGWAQRSDGPWPQFRLVITATPGVARLTGVRYVPLKGLDAGQIRQLARIRELEIAQDQAEDLRQLTGGSAGLISDALDALRSDARGKKPEGGADELVWYEALRKRIKSYPEWLGRFPDIMAALGWLGWDVEGDSPAVARLLDVGIIERVGNGYEIRAQLFEPLALYALDQTQRLGYEVDVYINAAPGAFSGGVEDFLSRLRARLEADLKRPVRVWPDAQGDSREGPLFQSWVMVNIMTQAFYQSPACVERALTFQRREQEAGIPLCLYVLAENVPLREQVAAHQQVNLVELVSRTSRLSPAYPGSISLAAQRAANQLVSMMLHAPGIPDPLDDVNDELIEEYSSEHEEMLRLIETQRGDIEDAIRVLAPERLQDQEIESDELPSTDHQGTVVAADEITFSLQKSSLELEGGGTATISATVRFERVLLYVYIEKSTYWSMDEKQRSFFPLLRANPHKHLVETQPLVTLKAVAHLRVDTEATESGDRGIISVDLDEVTDVELVHIHEYFLTPSEPEE
ncbi:MAG TPA: hypothetical protein VF815_12935 [Myxococcaceae bacterium]|jgi:hypothetical protein